MGRKEMDLGDIPPVPAIWQVELTNLCPYRCVGCPRQFMTRPQGYMAFSTFQACILAVEGFQQDVRPLGLHHFGESLLHPEIARLVSFATAQEVPTSLSCNPDHLSPALSQALIEAGLTRITFSLDGLDTSTLQDLRGAAADYGRAERGILDFLEAKSRLGSDCEVRVQMIAYRSNRHQWKPFIEKWKPYDVFCYVKKFDAWTHPDLAIQGAEPMRVQCTFPYRFVVVLWDGRVVPCCHDYDGELVMGSIHDGLSTVWNGEAYCAFRDQFHHRTLPADHMCRRCAWWPGGVGG
jgi:radical SAM protein with 4Fe4S-binding SPASM domain